MSTLPSRSIMEPAKLRKDAAHLLSLAPDAETLVADLLRQVRQHMFTEQAIRDGYGHSFRVLEDDIVRAYANGLRDCIDVVRDLRPAGNTRLTYDGFRGQALRRLRASLRWHDSRTVADAGGANV